MLASANDASVVLAEGIAGSVERFSELMTRKPRTLAQSIVILPIPRADRPGPLFHRQGSRYCFSVRHEELDLP